MPPEKDLEGHVRDGTFRPARHHELLAGPDVSFGKLAVLQRAYRLASSDPERRHVAVQFELAIETALTSGGPELTADQHMLASIGPCEPFLLNNTPTGRYRPATPLGKRWERWNWKHGLAWRQQHDCLTPQDTAGIARGERPDLTARAPNPPGWSAVS